MTKITDEKVLELEREYSRNRKDIILEGIRKASLSDKLHKLAVSDLAIFGTSMFIGYGEILGKINLGTTPSQILALVIGLTGFTTLGLCATSDHFEKEANQIAEAVKENDTVIKYKEEMNSRYMRGILSYIDPRLLKRYNKSRLQQPINIITYSSLSDDEKEILVRESKYSRKYDENELGIQYIDIVEDENQEILREAKKRRFIK